MSILINIFKSIAQSLFQTPQKQNSNQSNNNQNSASNQPVNSNSKIVKQYKMNYFDPAENSNKVWIGIAYDSGLFETQFGRVRDGKKLTVKQKQFSSQQQAERELEKKRNEKLRKGYKDTVVVGNDVQTTINNKSKHELSKIASEQIGGAAEDSVTSDLIKYLAEVNIHHITHVTSIKYNSSSATFSTPLGTLTPDAVSQARDLLNEIKVFNEAKSFDDAARTKFVREYFQLVPKDFGVKIPPVSELLASDEQFETEVAVLEALESALDTDDSKPKQKFFQCKLIRVPHYTEEGRNTFRQIRKLFEKTRNSKHHPLTAKLKLNRLYEVEIESMKANFEKKAREIGNIQQDLWHGTRASNLLSILKNGLIIPPANAAYCTGRMFGNGIYTSLQSTKALNYATNFWNQSGDLNQKTFMFLCEAALGKKLKPKMWSMSFPTKGYDSTWVEAGTAGVINHECIVYNTHQINLKYLAEFGIE